MNEMLKGLIPTDFTVQSEFAYLRVKNLQSAMPVEIHFLHVLAVPDTVTMDSLGNIQTCGEIDVNYVVKQRDSGSETQMIARRSRVPLLSLMCDRSDLKIKNILMVHNFSSPANENLNLLHKFIKAFDAQVHFLQITSGDPSDEMTTVEGNMAEFAAVNKIENYLCHLIKDSDIEGGVVHFNQMNNMDILCIGTHGKAGIFHQSATEKLINHLFKPIISFQLTNS